MNLNKSTRYALHAMMDLTLAAGQPETVAGIAARYDIPESALAKVLQQLVRFCLARGSRGVGGGYRLARPSSEVTVQDVIDVFEPPPPTDACLLREEDGAECPAELPECRLRNLFIEVAGTVRSTLQSVTLDTLTR